MSIYGNNLLEDRDKEFGQPPGARRVEPVEADLEPLGDVGVHVVKSRFEQGSKRVPKKVARGSCSLGGVRKHRDHSLVGDKTTGALSPWHQHVGREREFRVSDGFTDAAWLGLEGVESRVICPYMAIRKEARTLIASRHLRHPGFLNAFTPARFIASAWLASRDIDVASPVHWASPCARKYCTSRSFSSKVELSSSSQSGDEPCPIPPLERPWKMTCPSPAQSSSSQ